jgi:threonylcarbamoyladenosine tRNA methylthiotransferase MtaB
MKSVALHTLGCKVNYSESATIGRQFIERGYRVVESDQPADVYVLNTCSVTERADKECRQVVRRMLRQSPHAFVVVIGCYAQLQPEEISSIEGVDLILGANEKFNIFARAGDFIKRGHTQEYVSCIDEPIEYVPSSSGETDGRTRAYLKVQDGCDYSCSFCTIPRARGKSRSPSIESILAQANHLASARYREIVLTGVNVGDYGHRAGNSFIDLLHALENIPVDRIRISSIEPNLLTREIVEFILASDIFCNHFHIPMQSGSDAILRRMRRRYSTSDYANLTHFIKDRDQDAAIGADVLVGFPGETEREFEATYNFIELLPLSYLHVFTYSERRDTPAAEYPGAVDMHVRSNRNEILRSLGKQKRAIFNASFVGREVRVLVEQSAVPDMHTGLTTNYLRVEFESALPLRNEILPVRVVSSDEDGCAGEIIETSLLEPIHAELIHN